MPKPAIPHESARAYSVEEVAKFMRKPRGYVYDLIRAGQLRCLHLGSLRVPHEFLLEFYHNAEGIDFRDPMNPKMMEENEKNEPKK